MSSPITPIQGPPGPSDPMPAAGSIPADAHAFKAELAAGDRALASDAVLGGPPPEVMDQIAAAGRISRQLGESGHELRFSEGSGGRVTVELADREGNTVRTMKIAEALEIAAGKPLG
ncbi:MAG: hypothetical protein WBQ21_07265 [Solirubrobacteraceae bacterium]